MTVWDLILRIHILFFLILVEVFARKYRRRDIKESEFVLSSVNFYSDPKKKFIYNKFQLFLLALYIFEFLATPTVGTLMLSRQSFLAFQILGLFLATFGAVIFIYSRIIMGGLWVPAGWFSKNPKLISDGPFRLDRHPMYLGYLLLLIGIQVAFVNVGLVLHVYTYMGYRKIVKAEEKYLEEKLGGRYIFYKNKTRSIFSLNSKWSNSR